jgi:ribonucleoside-diphosphate reductase alpha chain
MDEFADDIGRQIWKTKYRVTLDGRREGSITESWRRIAHTLAAVEPSDVTLWEGRFFDSLRGFRFLPGGRIQAGGGTGRKVTLLNCFVMGAIEDSIPGIFRALEEGAVTMQQGGGVGYDFSTLRPKGSLTRTVGAIASGPVSFMRIWDAMCGTILSTGARRGAMMGTLRCDHPDIEDFVDCKRAPGAFRRFNLSVQITDDFIGAVRSDADWPLVFPAAAIDGDGDIVERAWPGQNGAVPCRILRRVRARALWERILRAAYDCAEPGVLFIDRINRLNNLGYRERISATNPCGEAPLPPYGACDLGSINLTGLVRAPFTPTAHIDAGELKALTRIAVRMLDNVIDASHYPLPEQAAAARGARRIGLGVTGLADALVMLGHRYDAVEANQAAAEIMRLIRDEAYRAACALAEEKGPFPFFDRDRYLEAPFIRTLPEDIRASIAARGIRNSHLLAIAPAGTISLLAGNVSSGLEPIFADRYTRRLLGEAGEEQTVEVTDFALERWRRGGGAPDGFPPAFVTAAELSVEAHLQMQAALQPFVDNSISKTVNAPQNCAFEDFRTIFDRAYDLGLKGCTAFRPNPVTGSLLQRPISQTDVQPCCGPDREAD